MFVKQARRAQVDSGVTPTQTAELGYQIMKAVAQYRNTEESRKRIGTSEHHFNIEVYGELMAIAHRWYDDFVAPYESKREDQHGGIW